MPTSEIPIVIADDHALVRAGLRQVIEAHSDLRVVGEARDGQEALDQIRSLAPRIAILDVKMPRLDGFGVAEAIQTEERSTDVIFLTMYAEPELYDAALAAGGKGYVLKDSALTEIVDAIRAVAAGLHFTSPAVTSHLVRRAAKAQAPPALAGLTPAERRVLKLVADLKTSKEIADELGIHYRTVENHRTNICQKLSLSGSHALVRFALKHRADLG